MYSATMQTVIILTALVLGLGGKAMAFTLRLGSIPGSNASSTIPATQATDVPTPQFFQIAISRNEMTLGTTHPVEGYTASPPEIRYQEVRASRPAASHEMRQASNLSPSPRLRGAELLLLRKTQVVADRQSE